MLTAQIVALNISSNCLRLFHSTVHIIILYVCNISSPNAAGEWVQPNRILLLGLVSDILPFLALNISPLYSSDIYHSDLRSSRSWKH